MNKDLLNLQPNFRFMSEEEINAMLAEVVKSAIKAVEGRWSNDRGRRMVYANLDGGLCDSLLRVSLMVSEVNTKEIDEARERGEITKAAQVWLHFHELLVNRKLSLPGLIKDIAEKYRVYPGIFKTYGHLLSQGVGVATVTNATKMFLEAAIGAHPHLRGFPAPLFANDLIFEAGDFWGLKVAASSEEMIAKGDIVRRAYELHGVLPVGCIGDGRSDIGMAEAMLEINSAGIIVACGIHSLLAEWCRENKLKAVEPGTPNPQGNYMVVSGAGFTPDVRKTLSSLVSHETPRAKKKSAA